MMFWCLSDTLKASLRLSDYALDGMDTPYHYVLENRS